jgi:hypothetical protein
MTMSNLLDAILGTFNSGQIGGFAPGDMLGNARSSGYLPEDQVSTPPTDPYGNRVGGPAPGVPLPRPRPPEAGLPAFSPPGMTPPDMRLSESGGSGFGPDGGLAAALGLDPDRAKTVMASLAGGLSNVKNSPFAGQVAANAAGGAIAGGNKAQDTEINQALRLRQINQRVRKPLQIAMPGNGTLQTPYQPATADDYAKILPGAHYCYWDGSIRRKGQPNTEVTNGAH